MSLRDLAASDAQKIIKDQAGFGWPLILTAPDGAVFNITGTSKDIHLSIDPDTGEIISGRTVTVTIATKDVSQTVRGINEGVPWKVTLNDFDGVSGVFKVDDTFPDRVFGLTVLFLVSWVE